MQLIERNAKWQEASVVVSRSGNRRPTIGISVLVLTLAALVVFGVGFVKRSSIETAYRHTQRTAAVVVAVTGHRIAHVRYSLDGATRSGTVDVSSASSIDRGDRVAVHVSRDGQTVLLDVPWLSSMYSITAAALALAAAGLLVWGWAQRSRGANAPRWTTHWHHSRTA